MVATLFMACNDDDNDSQIQNPDETADLILTKTISNSNHSIALYTKSGQLTDGYNPIYLQIKDNNGNLVNPTSISWNPMMHMTNMQHACPYSSISKVEGKQTLYSGYIVFTMAGNDSEYWDLKINYTIDGNTYEMIDNLDVIASSKRKVVSFKGTDNKKYVIAMIEPSQPKVAVNDMVAAVFSMESMTNFPIVNNYKVKIDPRMPGMGNHGTPNNQDLIQGNNGFYNGKVSFTMTGYWKINLMLENQNGEILKGEPVTDSNESSSIFFEVEF